MKSIPKLIRRFVNLLLLSSFLLIALNIAAFILIIWSAIRTPQSSDTV